MMVLAFYIASADGLMVEQPDNTSNGHAQIGSRHHHRQAQAARIKQRFSGFNH
jgi:hypothetical protein